MANTPAAPAAIEAPLDVDAELLEDGDDGEEITEVEVGQIMHHPDGYYWQTPDGKQEFGPFEDLELALAHMQSAVEEESAGPGETLQEAEDELGVADWVDPDTGELAEGQSTPRLHDE
jgi:hypothetical protein